MRWLFLFLLVLNLLCLLLWGRQEPLPSTATAVVQTAQAGDGGIRLLSELPAGQLKPRGAAQEQARTTENSALCHFVGGLEHEYEANALRQRLANLDIRAQVQAVDLPAALDYWMYLSPLPSAQAAAQQMAELQAQGIDGQLIAHGDLSNGISLGLFASPEQAERLKQRLRGAGFQPQLLQLSREQRSYWLRLLSEEKPLDAGTLKTLTLDFSGLQQRTAPCSKLASAL